MQFWRETVNSATCKIWEPSNIYPSALLGTDVNIGTFCEIGKDVVIGDRTRIGAHSFIPEGVIIGNDVFIGPRVTFTNDKYPPSSPAGWEMIVVKDKAAIGAGSIILPNVFIGENALVGAGSVVTKSVPSREVWAGNPAKYLGNIEEISELRQSKEAKGDICNQRL